jgi:hypothetical protein
MRQSSSGLPAAPTAQRLREDPGNGESLSGPVDRSCRPRPTLCGDVPRLSGRTSSLWSNRMPSNGCTCGAGSPDTDCCLTVRKIMFTSLIIRNSPRNRPANPRVGRCSSLRDGSLRQLHQPHRSVWLLAREDQPGTADQPRVIGFPLNGHPGGNFASKGWPKVRVLESNWAPINLRSCTM